MNEPLEATGSVGLGIHLGLLTEQTTRRQHLLPKRRELLTILAVLPMESMEVERSFYCIRRILSDLAVIAMYGDRNVVCGKFVALHPKRMTASLLLDVASFSSIL